MNLGIVGEQQAGGQAWVGEFWGDPSQRGSGAFGQCLPIGGVRPRGLNGDFQFHCVPMPSG